MLYVTFSAAADIVAFKFATVLGLVESGATILFPLTYVIGDVTCEVYGWQISMKIVWMGLLCELIFALLCTMVVYLPGAHINFFQTEYVDLIGKKLLLFVGAGIISNAIAGLLNIFFISKWKILIRGKVFWVRSILATCISEFILILITVLIAFVPFINLTNTIHVFVNAYLLEIIYAVIFVIPAQMLVLYLKRQEGIDAYDYGISYNPFNFIQQNTVTEEK